MTPNLKASHYLHSFLIEDKSWKAGRDARHLPCILQSSILKSRLDQIRCFEFVPSNYENAWSALSSLEPCRFCEWGSGLGVAVGLAEMLGYDACGIEIDAELAEQSRQFLAEHGLKSPIHTGSYFDFSPEVDLVYVYCWPGQVAAVEQLFFDKMPDHARMLRAYGQDDLRLYVKNPEAIAARDAAK